MHVDGAVASERQGGDPAWWHLLLLLAVSVWFESRFLHRGLNLLDEGWPLYAAMQLHHGGVLYDNVFFVFPPGHLLSAWIGYGLGPPGVVATRTLYAAFNVALCLVVYLLGRRVMPAPYALLGAGLLAVASPYSHLAHFHFGYRYLVVSALALLAFSQRLRTGSPRWMAVAGVCIGVAVCFRLTPAFAAGFALGVAVMAADRSWRTWLRDWAWLAAGIAIVVLPVLAWFAQGVGLDTLWSEAVVRPVIMTGLQSKSIPPLEAPDEWTRDGISRLFTAVEFRVFSILYLAYAGALLSRWGRAWWQGRAFDAAFLLCLVTWGGVYFLRSLGRSDIGHLESAIPPICLLLAHAQWSTFRLLWSRRPTAPSTRRYAEATVAVVGLSLWIGLLGSDRRLGPANAGSFPLLGVPEQIYLENKSNAERLAKKIKTIQRWARPDEIVLDMSSEPLFHVLADRVGPGYSDILMPGTFLTEAEELDFLERLQSKPPALVIWPQRDFDKLPDRGLVSIAPQVARWVHENYEPRGRGPRHLFLRPKGTPRSAAPPG